MSFDKGLVVGATGGHGPIGYRIESLTPRRSILFRFIKPAGLHGTHRLELQPQNGQTLIIHTIDMRLTGWQRLTWPLVLGPLHDALVEDAFTTTEEALGQDLTVKRWSLYIRLLRWILTAGKAPRQEFSGSRNMQKVE